MLPFAIAGAALASVGVAIKELALPPLALLAFCPFLIRKPYKPWIILFPIIAYSAYWGYAWIWPQQAHRMGNEHEISLQAISHGWERLLELYDRGLPIGKFDQLIFGALFLSLWTKTQRTRRIILAIGGAITLCYLAHILDQKTRPRYIGPSSLGVLVAMGVSLSLLIRKQWLFPTLIGGLFLLDGWSFFDVWSKQREQIVGSLPSKLPEAPSIWKRQYTHMSDLTHRDLTLYGGAELARLVQKSDGLATPRLRDERHRSLAAFSALYGKQFVVLNPGDCCYGQPVNAICAQKILSELNTAGISLALPIPIKGVERIYKHEQKWLTHLQTAAGTDLIEGIMWQVLPNTRTGGKTLPCQNQAPFRSAK